MTLSKLTALYFLFALLHMFIQGGFQVASHITNRKANDVLEAIRSKANALEKLIPIITPNPDGSGDTLRLCDGIPQSGADQTCQPIFDSPPPGNQRPKPPRDQNQFTTTPQALQSDVFLASQKPANGDSRYLSATASGNIPSNATVPVAPGATNAANRPVAGLAVASSVNGEQVVSSRVVSRSDEAVY